jgi:hypothetical protein
MALRNRLRTPPSDARRPIVVDRTLAGNFCRNRVVEWLCAIMLINFGLTCALSPSTLSVGSFKYLTALGVTPFLFTAANAGIGIVRVMALYFNGYGLPWSARVRALCAIYGACVFGVMGLSLVYLTRDTGVLSLGAGTHFALALVELYSCLRAGADVADKYRYDARRLDEVAAYTRCDDARSSAR